MARSSTRAPGASVVIIGGGVTGLSAGWWLARSGVDVLVYSGDEISRKGDGGPTCLTRPILRSA